MAKTTVPIELSSTPSIVDNGNATAITIDSSENVGIGTSPSAFVHLRNGAIEDVSGSVIRMDLSGINPYWEIQARNGGSAGNRKLGFYTSATSADVLTLAQDGNVGIGTSSPSVKLNIVAASGDADMVLASATQTLRVDQNSIRTTTNSNLHIFTNGNTNQLYLNQSTGNVGIGTSSPAQKLHVNGYQLFENANEIRWKDSGGTQRTAIALDSSNNFNIGTSAGGNLIFRNGSSYTERMRILSDGALNIQTGFGATMAYFGGSATVNGITGLPSATYVPFVVGRDTGSTKSASFGGHVNITSGYGLSFDGGSNYLDDYEEGTFTPSTTGLTGVNIRACRYTKVGRLVTVDMRVEWTGTDNSASGFQLGLPFTAANPGDPTAGTGIVFYSGTAIFSGVISAHVAAGSSNVSFYDATGGSFAPVDRNDINGSYDWLISFFYYT